MPTKAKLTDRLEVALGMLTEIAEHPRLPKAKKEEIAAFAEEVRSGLSGGGSPAEGSLFRIATVINPATGKPATVPVKADGSHTPRFAHMEPATEWIAVRAGSWAAATAKAKEGDGESFTAAPKAKKTPKNKKAKGKGKAKKAPKAETAKTETSEEVEGAA
jgi:hypothetical protein